MCSTEKSLESESILAQSALYEDRREPHGLSTQHTLWACERVVVVHLGEISTSYV